MNLGSRAVIVPVIIVAAARSELSAALTIKMVLSVVPLAVSRMETSIHWSSSSTHHTSRGARRDPIDIAARSANTSKRCESVRSNLLEGVHVDRQQLTHLPVGDIMRLSPLWTARSVAEEPARNDALDGFVRGIEFQQVGARCNPNGACRFTQGKDRRGGPIRLHHIDGERIDGQA